MRGIERRKIFRNEEDREDFLDRLSMLRPETEACCYHASRGYMSIALKAGQMLWGRSGNHCAVAECREDLVIGATGTGDESSKPSRSLLPGPVRMALNLTQ